MPAGCTPGRLWPTWRPSDCCSNAIHRRDASTEQLQTALNSRVLIEQAEGVLAERLHLDVP
jgi:ANTAR domain